MLSSQNFNPNIQQLVQPSKLGSELIKGEQQPKPQMSNTEAAVTWYTVERKEGGLELTAIPNTYEVDVTSVSVRAEEVTPPKDFNLLGYKIDIGSKIDSLKDSYVKNFALTKSHNLMVARFAELKTGAISYALSILGCSTEELRKLQKEAMDSSIKQNKLLFAENEYNAELLAIIGGNKKQIKAQQKVISEIRKQLVAQANNLGLKDQYTNERVLEIQIEQCDRIKQKFADERDNLNYQLNFCGVN